MVFRSATVPRPFSREAAVAFAQRFATTSSEKSNDRDFWIIMLQDVCGIVDPQSRLRYQFTARRKSTKRVGWPDMIWDSVVLIEQKSRRKPGQASLLPAAIEQARDYLIPDDMQPRYYVVCDFGEFIVDDSISGTRVRFTLDQLPEHLDLLREIFEEQVEEASKVERTVNAEAADLMARLYRALVDGGYPEEHAQMLLVRLLFLNFGDDTGMWERVEPFGLFASLVEHASPVTLGGLISSIFRTLDTPRAERSPNLSGAVAKFPYVNGRLFSEGAPIADFTQPMYDEVLRAARYDWSKVDAMVFGTMFQDVKSKLDRRELGAHYTSEANIKKVIGPLFLDDVIRRIDQAWDDPGALLNIRLELGDITDSSGSVIQHGPHFLDPACGSGNFLMVAYRELRRLENRIIGRAVTPGVGGGKRGVVIPRNTVVSLAQFHGIEIDPWPVHIASVVLLLVQHQMDREMERVIHPYHVEGHFPLDDRAKPSVIQGNALTFAQQLGGWAVLIPPKVERAFIMGNPPFVGHKGKSRAQAADQKLVWGSIRGAGDVDFVGNWFLLTARLMQKRPGYRAALVATNSITQGVQVPTLWNALKALGVGIDFAHEFFVWSNGSKQDEDAAVTVTAIGSALLRSPQPGPCGGRTGRSASRH